MCNNERFSFLNVFILVTFIGVLVGIFNFLGLITIIDVYLIVGLISAFIISILFFVVVIIPRYVRYVRKHGCGIVFGIIGTIVFLILSYNLDTSSALESSIIIGISAFFISYLVIKFLKLISCIIEYNSIYNCDNLAFDNNIELGDGKNENQRLNLNRNLDNSEVSLNNDLLNENIVQEKRYNDSNYCKYNNFKF